MPCLLCSRHAFFERGWSSQSKLWYASGRFKADLLVWKDNYLSSVFCCRCWKQVSSWVFKDSSLLLSLSLSPPLSFSSHIIFIFFFPFFVFTDIFHLPLSCTVAWLALFSVTLELWAGVLCCRCCEVAGVKHRDGFGTGYGRYFFSVLERR